MSVELEVVLFVASVYSALWIAVVVMALVSYGDMVHHCDYGPEARRMIAMAIFGPIPIMLYGFAWAFRELAPKKAKLPRAEVRSD